MLKRLQPPHVLLAALVMMALLHLALPVARLLALPWNLLGLVPVAVGMALHHAGVRALKRARTTTHTRGVPSALVTGGVFRISRHPVYLGFGCVVAGCAAILGTLAPLLVVPGFVLAVDRLFIAPEERRLAARFRGTWAGYRAGVRRWL